MSNNNGKIGQEYGHWQLPRKLRTLLCSCTAKESTRYAINGISVKDGIFAATDGRRLIEVTTKTTEIPAMIYWCTTNGWLLGPIEGNFPKYEAIIPGADKLIDVCNHKAFNTCTASAILGSLVKAGLYCDASLLWPVLMAMKSLDMRDIRVSVHKENTKETPFIIEGSCAYGPIRYVQMPVQYHTD